MSCSLSAVPRWAAALLLWALSGYVLANTTITGRVVTQSGQTPLEGAIVTLINDQATEPIAAVSTDSNGRYLLTPVLPGKYAIQIDRLGYQSSLDTVFVGERSDVLNLGDVYLPLAGQVLEEVVTTAQRQQAGVSIDRRVYAMEDNFAQSGGNLLEALRGLPGITVEEDGQLRLRGSDRVVVMIDGKQSALAGYSGQRNLESIPVGNIESIEIINNPSARYDSSGAAGIVNIVYRKSAKEGWSGDYGLTGGLGVLSQREADLPTEMGSITHNGKISPTLNLGYLSGRTRAFFQGELLVQDALPNNEFSVRRYDDGRTILSQVPENREQTRVILRAGADIALTQNNRLSLSAIFDRESHEDNAQVPFIDAETGDWVRYWFWREEEVTGFASAAIKWIYEFDDPGHTLEASLEYISGWEDESYFINEISPIREGTDATFLYAEEYTLPLNISYVRPLSFGSLEVGARLQKRWIPVEYQIEQGQDSILYPGLGERTKWSEDIGSIYANFLLETEKNVIEAGVRVEHTKVTYEIDADNIYYDEGDRYDYFEIYPSVRLIRNLSADFNLSVAFSRRVDRPGEPELRIFPKVDDPELMKVGNPYLRPEFTDSWEFALEKIWGTGSAILSLYYRDIEDSFRRIYSIDESNEYYDIVNRTYQNTGSEQDMGLELIWSQDINESLRLSGSLNAYRIAIDPFQGEVLFPSPRPFYIEANNDSTWDGKITLLAKLPWQLEAQATLAYYDERAIAQGYRLSRSSLDLGLRKPLKSMNGEITFAFTDTLNDFAIRERISAEGLTADYNNYFETQIVRIGVKIKL